MNKILKRLEKYQQAELMNYVDSPSPEHLSVMGRATPNISLKDEDIKLSPFPKNNSDKTKNELLFLERLTSNVSASDVELIKKTDEGMIENLFMKDYIYPDKDEIILKLYNLKEQINAITMRQKYKFNRPRPQQLAEVFDYKINVFKSKTTSTPSYPSGHTTLAYVIAYISSDMNPSNRSRDLHLANSVANARMLMGVHYPSDNSASISLAKQIYSAIDKSWFTQV